MIISRRKYEQDLKEAAEKSRYETEREFFLRERFDWLQEQIDNLMREERL